MPRGERNFAENYSTEGKEKEHIFPTSRSKIPEKEMKVITVVLRVHFSLYIYIYTRIGISDWVIGNTKAAQSGGINRVNRSPTVATSPRLAALEHKLFMLVKISWIARFLAKHVRQ